MTTRRALTSRSGGRRFWWQGALILLPVLALAGAGLWALRQDRLAAEQELKERAQRLADEVAQRVRAVLAPPPGSNLEQVRAYYLARRATNFLEVWLDDKGNVLQSVPTSSLHRPRELPSATLSDAPRALWEELDSLIGKPGARRRAKEVCVALLDMPLPPAFAARAAYDLGVLELADGQTNAAIRAFERALPLSTNQYTAAGLPLDQLVQLRLLELWPLEKLEEARQAAAVAARTRGMPPDMEQMLHPWLFDNFFACLSPVCAWQAEIADRRGLRQQVWRLMSSAVAAGRTNVSHLEFWQFLRLRHEARGAAQQWQMDHSGAPFPQVFWCAANRDFLAVRVEVAASEQVPSVGQGMTGNLAARMPSSVILVCLPEESCRSLWEHALLDFGHWPKHLGAELAFVGQATVSLAGPHRLHDHSGQTFQTSQHAAGNVPTADFPILAESVLFPEWSGSKVRVRLRDRAQFHAQLRRRAALLGGLVAASALAALAGWWAAYRAFHKQQRLAEMKSNFVSSVSHELRAPIASMRLMVEGLESGKIAEPSKQQEYFRFISQECRRLSALIENVLDFARIERGRKPYEWEPTDAVALVKATVQLLEPVAREKGVTLQIEMDEADLAAVQPHWDGRAVQQALINLLDNAIKYSPRDARVTVGLKRHGNALRLSVTDAGPGIPAAEHQRIFERFYRIGSEMRRESQGVGIGLSLVKHIVEAHGGRVLLRSAPGRGSCFTLELPMGNTEVRKKSETRTTAVNRHEDEPQ